MAKDDYFVIMYRILAYIYACMKEGEKFNPEVISFEALDIPESYWSTIILSMKERGYIDGVFEVPILGVEKGVKWGTKVEITPEGVEFLEENSRMNKAKDFLKTVKEIIPGL